MRKIWISTFLLVSVFFLNSPVIGEEYVSKDFPSNEIILKNLKNLGEPPDKILILGKTGGNNSFVVFFLKTSGEIRELNFIRLDTKIWLFSRVDVYGYMLLQK